MLFTYKLLSKLALILSLGYFTFFNVNSSYAGGPPGGCTPATTIACSAPSATCTDPIFNAGSGGSVNCTTATPISMPGCQSCISGTTANTADLTSTTFSCGTVDGIAWFIVTVPASQNTFTVTPGTLQNPIVIVDNGATCADAAYNTCGSATGSNPATANWGFSPGDAVIIGVGSTSGNDGTFTLCVQSLPPPPTAGNTCALANIICSTDPIPYNTNCATASGQTPGCFLAAPQQDTWIRFTVLANGTIGWTGNPNANAEFDWALWNVTSGCPGTLVSCNYDFAGQCGDNFGMASPDPGTEYNATVNATAGQVYAIQIDNYSGNGVGFSFDWTGTAVITPTAGFTMNNDFSCAGSLTVDFTHTGVGNAAYEFGNGASYTGNNPPNQNYTTGTYSVTATATSGACIDVFTDYVTIYAPLAGTITSTNASCATTNNGSATVTSITGGDGIYTYVWSGPSQNGATTSTISGLSPGNYSVTISNATCGTSIVLNTVVSANPNPTFTVAGTNPSTCGGTNGSILISGLNNSVSYSVIYFDGPTQVGPTNYTTSGTGTINLTGLNAGNYSGYSITLVSSGCTGTSPTVITLVDPGAPVLTITNPPAACSPSTVNITVASVTAGSTGGGTLSYWNDAGATSALATPSAVSTSGTYYIQVNNAGCIDIEPVVVTINASPILTITNPTAVCSPSTVDITAATVTAGSTNPGTLTYWTNAGATTALASPSAVGTSGTYYIQANNLGCTDIEPVTVTINATPVLTITNPAGVCSPSTVNITAAAVTAGSTNPGTLSYWNDAGATSSLASPSTVGTSGTYYIQATNTGCTDIEAVVVSIGTTPVLTITNPTAVCSPSTVDITAAAVTAGSTNPGTLSYWNDAGATSSLASPSAVGTSGTYYIQGANGVCTDIEAVVVTVNTTPVLTITNPTAVCSPSTVDITAAAVTAGSTNPGTLTYWNDAGATSSLASPSTVGTSGTYYIQATNTGCTDIESVVVSIGTTPVLTITNPTAVCSPSTVDITAAAITAGSTNPGTLTYWNDAGASSSLAAPSAVGTSGTYYIQGANGACTDIEAVVVTVNTTPVLTITNPTAVCSPSTVDITAAAVTAGSTNPGTLSYWNDAGATSSLVSPSTVGTSGTYYIQATNTGCTDIEAVVVSIGTTPVLTITNPTAVCSPSTVDLTAAAVTAGSTNPGTLTYWTNAGATTALASPSAVGTSGTYYIQGANGVCTDIEAVVVTVNTTPVLTITNPAGVCSPSTVDLTAVAVTAGSTNPGTLSYWNDAGATSSLASPSTVGTSGTYYIQATNTGCTDIEAVVVSVGTTPVLTITNPTAVCSPSTVDITAAAITAGSTNPGTLTYWNDAGATSSLASPSAVGTSGTYYIQGANGACTDIEAVVVTVNATPVLTITNPAGVCSPSTIDLTAAAVTVGSTNPGTLSYWNDAGATSSLASPSTVGTSGTYYIQAANAGCTDIGPVTVSINAIPSAPTAGTDTTYCSSWEYVAMTAVGAGGTYTWYSDAGLTSTLGTGGSLMPTDVVGTTVYYVTETMNTCEGPASTVTIVIEDCEIIVPTAFTPDGDNVNDYWEILDLDAVYPNNIVMVYNRWGSLLYQSEEGKYSSNPWKGDFKGAELPVGSYYFIIDFQDEKVEPQKGIVSIILNK